jgi:hypothetical protein
MFDGRDKCIRVAARAAVHLATDAPLASKFTRGIES